MLYLETLNCATLLVIEIDLSKMRPRTIMKSLLWTVVAVGGNPKLKNICYKVFMFQGRYQFNSPRGIPPKVVEMN